MNIVFIGASRFGLRCLRLACNLPDCKVTGIVTAARRFSISYRPQGITNVLHADIAGFAADHGVVCRTIDRGMNDSALLDAVKMWKPDAFLVVGWYHMVPKTWRKLAPAYGLHASLLPDYSGGAPLVWAMINGESRTGITLFQMEDGVDTGPIVAQAEEQIEARDTIATLYARIEERGLALLRSELPRLANGTAVLRNQPSRGRRLMPQRSPEDGLIDWRKDSTSIDLFIRAQTKPYPGAYTALCGKRMIIWAARSSDTPANGSAVGSVIHTSASCCVICGEGALELEEIEINGRTITFREIRDSLPLGTLLGSNCGVRTAAKLC